MVYNLLLKYPDNVINIFIFFIVTFTKRNPFYNGNNLWSHDIPLKAGFTVHHFGNKPFNCVSNNNPNVRALHLLVKSSNNSQPKFRTKTTCPSETEKITKLFKCKTSSGCNEISLKLLKRCSSEFSKPLSHICNHSLIAEVFPQRLKHAIVKPLFKNSNKSIPSNYRPISLLTSFSKVFEKVMYSRLINYFNSNNIITPSQFGFRKGMSMDMATFKLILEILEALDKKQYAMGIFCDLAKAFDCINHDLLLQKLHFYGIDNVTLKWFVISF